MVFVVSHSGPPLDKSIPTRLLCRLSEASVAPRADYTDSLAKPCPDGTEGPYFVRERSERTAFTSHLRKRLPSSGMLQRENGNPG
jgi:hypothetical protein